MYIVMKTLTNPGQELRGVNRRFSNIRFIEAAQHLQAEVAQEPTTAVRPCTTLKVTLQKVSYIKPILGGESKQKQKNKDASGLLPPPYGPRENYQ